MKKIKTILPIVLGTTTISGCIVPTMTSCGETDLYKALRYMPRVAKVSVLPSLPAYQERYMVWFKHPIDWNDESKGTFLQRCEFCFKGKDRVNQLFTCGYELRAEVLSRTDYEICDHFNGNLIKPEYRFFDKSRPEGLDNHEVAGWENLTNANAVADFHSMIESFKTILTGKWAFTGTSKGGETTNIFAMTYPNDCAAYVPYVAPKLYSPQGADAKPFQYNVYHTIGDDVLGKENAKKYRTEISKFQWYALQHKQDTIDGIKMYEKFWEPYKYNDFCTWAKNNHEDIFDMCLQECATQFWQGSEDIWALIEFNNMPEDEEEEIEAKTRKCISLMQGLNDPTTWQQDSLFFPYAYQAKVEMGEYDYDFVEMKSGIAENLEDVTEDDVEEKLCQTNKDKRGQFIWLAQFSDNQYEAWKDKFDSTMRDKLLAWNDNCPVHVFRIYGGTDVWSGLRLPDNPTDKVKIYWGKDTSNPRHRSHTTRIKGLSDSDQREIWAQLEALLQD